MNCRSSVDFPQSVKRQKIVKDVDERFTKLKMTSANVLICPQPNNISQGKYRNRTIFTFKQQK